ncbi:hypothetical protein NW757_014138 [Fusarium falciforme]|nr:hypothetical protein NW757_014138 [Fusarium falciforme]
MERVVGYFEGWAKNRPCEVFWPEDIPIGLYTHINFAFGTINPNTFAIEANDPEDEDMYQRLMLLKKKDKNLKIYLAIGGWTFNDPGPTAKVFSDLAASPARQRSFFNSIMSFVATHKFDGLDLDWEYPVAEERAGRVVDYKNFPVFMAALKRVMDTADKGLTITLPASYWYLQYFDIKKLEPTVDFFNIMSYDLHGAWDQNVNWTKPYLNAHTNLTEIESALDLLWRNNIEPSKVVMGLGFYGRAFTAASAACRKPGCLFSAPANEGKCSRESGILLNSEIDIEVKNRNLKPELYKEEAVKVVTWGKQWVSYDDAETLKMKVERASERCLGGVMVWAISHDTEDAKYNKALAKVLGREVTSGSLDDDEKAAEFEKRPNEQCRWSNCKEGCPRGWVHVGRLDSGARKGELMYDETGCGGDGAHSFCCPPDEDIPECGWYGHGGGKCQKVTECPSGMVEIGSNQMYCKKPPRVQTACCKTNTKSMKLYGTCQWGDYPECETSPECPNDTYNWLTASSGSGSGGLKCNDRTNDLGSPIIGVQLRNYCCSVKPGLRFIDCSLHRDVGPAPDNMPDGFCRSGCPNDRVRVALDTEVPSCSSAVVGGMTTCCRTDYYDEVLVPNEKLKAYQQAMADWVENETCPNPFKVFTKRRRSLSSSSSSTELAVRADKMEDITIHVMLTNIIARVGSAPMLDQQIRIWNDAVRYEYLGITYISNYIRQNWRLEWQGPSQMAIDILCNPSLWANRIQAFLTGDIDAIASILNCTYGYCDQEGYCEDLGDGSPDLKRRHATLLPLGGAHMHSSRFAHSHHHHHHHRRSSGSKHLLETRAVKTIKVKDPENGAAPNEYNAEIPNNSPAADINKKTPNNPVLKNAVEFFIRDDCRHTNLMTGHYRDLVAYLEMEVEHVLDKIILEMFFQDSATGNLKSGEKSKYGPIPIAFWDAMEDINLEDEANWPIDESNPPTEEGEKPKKIKLPALPGGKGYKLSFLMDRAFECLGSDRNDQVFTIVEEALNAGKGKVMQGYRTVSKVHLRELLERKRKTKKEIKEDSEKVLDRMRAGFAAFKYLKMDDTKKKLDKIVKDVFEQFKFAETVYNQKYPDRKEVKLSSLWIEWIKDYYGEMERKLVKNVGEMVTEARFLLDGLNDYPAREAFMTLRSFEKQAEHAPKYLRIDTSGFPTIGDEDVDIGGT